MSEEETLEAIYREAMEAKELTIKLTRRQHGTEVEVTGKDVDACVAAYLEVCHMTDNETGYAGPKKGSAKEQSISERSRAKQYAIQKNIAQGKA